MYPRPPLQYLFLLTIAIALLALPPSSTSTTTTTTTATGPTYHNGQLLTGPDPINIYLIWYGTFSQKDKTTITDFFSSFNTKTSTTSSTISKWWSTTSSYKDNNKNTVSPTINLVKQLDDTKQSVGKNIKRAQIVEYVKSKIQNKTLPLDSSNGVYLVLTAADVIVERFCTGSCGSHDSITLVDDGGKKSNLVYAHVGDPLTQCPGHCSWPFAVPSYGPPRQVALVAPNGIGVDGMVMNIATVLAGAVTNPFKTGYFQGDALAPLEAITACPGVFGSGAYPGYPGNLMVDKTTKASYNANANGANGRKFLLPAMWDPIHSNCTVV